MARGLLAAIALAAMAGIVPSLFMAFAGMFAFDAPDAATHVMTYVIAATCLSAPALLACSAMVALDAMRRPERRKIWFAAALLAGPAIMLLLLFDPVRWRI